MNGVKYDPQVYTATVTVSYDVTSGVLTVGQPVYTKADGTAANDGAVFTNDVVGSLRIQKAV